MSSLATNASERRGEPYAAALLTWAVPGAGHMFLGMPIFGLIAFVVIQGLYFAGLRLTGGMLFEYLETDLRGPVAGVLTPEVGNLGMLVYHTQVYGYGVGHPRVWPEWMHLGTWLTSTSGILNACLIVRAQLDAKQRRGSQPFGRSPLVEIVSAWLVPGLGHWLQGRRLRAAVVFVLLCGLFALGTLLCEGSNLDRERHFYYWAGQFLLGAPVMIAEFLHGHALITHDIDYVDAGLGMVCVAGLLNVLSMIDVYSYWEQRESGGASPSVTPAGGEPQPSAAAPKAGTLA